ncbi:high-affinity glucose transporter 1 [Diutina catenulata]
MSHAGVIEYPVLERPWWRYRHLAGLAGIVVILTLSSSTSGYDGSVLNALQSLSSWQAEMDYPKGRRLGNLGSAQVFGQTASMLFSSWAAEFFGRRLAIVIGNLIIILGAVLQGTSQNYGWFFAARFVVGLGSGLHAVAAPALIAELAYAPHREVSTANFNVQWYLGAVIAAWVTYGTRTIASAYSWRIPSYLQGALPVAQLVLLFFVPESPRWLVSRGRVSQARDILHHWHFGRSQSDCSLALVDAELNEIESAIQLEKLQQETRYIDFLRTPGNRKRLFLCIFTPMMMQLSGNGLVSYYLNLVLTSIGITEEQRQLQLNGCLMITNFVTATFFACITWRFRRRTMFLTSLIAMLVCYVIWTILSAINQQRHFKDESFARGVLAMIFLYYTGYNVALSGFPFLYVTEALSFSLRAKGLNIFSLTMCLCSIFNGYVNPIGMANIGWRFYIVYCCVVAVEIVVVYFFYPETSGYTLEEVARVFDPMVAEADKERDSSQDEENIESKIED